MVQDKQERKMGGIPLWLIQWLIPALLTAFVYMADRKISSLEKRLADQEAFQEQYRIEQSAYMERQIQMIRDVRYLCGQGHVNFPCDTIPDPPEKQINKPGK